VGKFAGSDILRAILDQGCDPGEYERQYEASLREAERSSVQDYISESENLVSLHNQAILASLLTTRRSYTLLTRPPPPSPLLHTFILPEVCRSVVDIGV